MSDAIAYAAPISLFLVHIANFIGGELYGRVTGVPWGMAFPAVDDLPRLAAQGRHGPRSLNIGRNT